MKQHFLSSAVNQYGERLDDVIKVRLKKASSILQLINPYIKDFHSPRLIGIGSGFCTLEHVFSTKYLYSEIICLEPDKKAIESLTNKKFKKINDSALNIESLKLGAFDIILCHQVLEHINNYEDVLSQMVNIMKKGSVCYINVPNPWAVTSVTYPTATGKYSKISVIIKSFFICMSYKFHRDFMTNTEKYHTGFTRKIIRKYFLDHQIIDLRKDRIKQSIKFKFAKKVVDILPLIIIDIISPTNIWIVKKS